MSNSANGFCKCCKKDNLVKIYKKLAKSGNKLYVDDKGRLWKSSICADCQAAHRRISYKTANSANPQPQIQIDQTPKGC